MLTRRNNENTKINRIEKTEKKDLKKWTTITNEEKYILVLHTSKRTTYQKENA